MVISNSKERLHELLEYYSISQNEFGRRTGLNKSTVSMFINGKRIPNQNSLYAISKTFGVDVAWLMGYDVPMFPRQVIEPSRIEDAELVGKIMADEDMLILIKKIYALPPEVIPALINFVDAAVLCASDKK